MFDHIPYYSLVDIVRHVREPDIIYQNIIKIYCLNINFTRTIDNDIHLLIWIKFHQGITFSDASKTLNVNIEHFVKQLSGHCQSIYGEDIYHHLFYELSKNCPTTCFLNQEVKCIYLSNFLHFCFTESIDFIKCAIKYFDLQDNYFYDRTYSSHDPKFKDHPKLVAYMNDNGEYEILLGFVGTIVKLFYSLCDHGHVGMAKIFFDTFLKKFDVRDILEDYGFKYPRYSHHQPYLKMMKFLIHDIKIDIDVILIDKIARDCCQSEIFEIVKFYFENQSRKLYLDTYKTLIRESISKGCLDITKYLVERAMIDWSNDKFSIIDNCIMIQIMENGHLDVLEYVVQILGLDYIKNIIKEIDISNPKMINYLIKNFNFDVKNCSISFRFVPKDELSEEMTKNNLEMFKHLIKSYRKDISSMID